MEGTNRNLARVFSGCPCPDGIPAKSTAQMLSKAADCDGSGTPPVSAQTLVGGHHCLAHCA